MDCSGEPQSWMFEGRRNKRTAAFLAELLLPENAQRFAFLQEICPGGVLMVQPFARQPFLLAWDDQERCYLAFGTTFAVAYREFMVRLAAHISV